MAFQEISGKKTVPQRELEILEHWRKSDIFRRHVELNENGPDFVFFEGPPTANGKPGIHHVLSRVFKDIYIRYKGQQGYHIPRQAGWDCHGLPVEREVEKKLGIKAKSEIETDIGLEKFNEMCRESVSQYVGEWHRFSERLGFFIDLDNAYFTMDNSYIEAVWSLLKQIHENGLMYQGYKVVPFDPVMGATMSDAEVGLGYKTVEDPSLTVRFRVADPGFDENTYFLVWTTTPWTLPSNVALAMHPDEDYVLLKREILTEAKEETADGEEPDEKKGKKKKKKGGEKKKLVGTGQFEHLICAKALMESLLKDESPEIIKTYKGSELKGTAYEPLFDWMEMDEGKKHHLVLNADFVTMDTGTGIVHIAPAYGADDLEVGIANDLPVVHAAGLDGNFVEATPIAGTFFKDADPAIIKMLKERGLVWKSERYTHEYPFGWRTGAPLMYFAKDAWYIRTTQVREGLISNNDTINWVPGTIKHGRFGNWLENNRDWALSRERYWGTPLPIWSDGEGGIRIIGSVAELEKLSGKELSKLDLHRPYIDEIEFNDPDTGKPMKRVPEVIDAWFDSGSMPYAQWGFPVKGKKEFDHYFPADFISEAIDQTRGWFYTLLAVSTMISGKSSYKNVVCLGHVLDEKGEKMSKSKGNIVPPDAVFDSHGADAIRWYFLTGAPPGNSRRLGMPGKPGDPLVQVHGFFNMIVNSVNFFVMYANVDGVSITGDWENAPIQGAPPFADRPEIDRWILSSLQNLVQSVTDALDVYDAQKGGRLMEEFADSLSNWYIRRNRRRFWKGELDADKLAAYDTLYRTLVTIARLLAPYTPYLAEQVFRTMVSGATSGAPDSIHLTKWPVADFDHMYDESMLREGDLVQLAASLGRTARQQSAVKVRQPLSRLMIHLPYDEDKKAVEKNAEVLKEELNVKELIFLDETAGILDYRIKPNLPRLGKRLGSRLREVQSFFQQADAREIAAKAKAGENIEIPVENDEPLILEAEDVLVESVSKEGTSGVEGSGMLVALDTELTDELIQEGYVRDLVRNIQELRKKSGLAITDRIELEIANPTETLAGAVKSMSDYIENETLGTIVKSSLADVAGEQDVKIDEESATIRIRVKG